MEVHEYVLNKFFFNKSGFVHIVLIFSNKKKNTFQSCRLSFISIFLDLFVIQWSYNNHNMIKTKQNKKVTIKIYKKFSNIQRSHEIRRQRSVSLLKHNQYDVVANVTLSFQLLGVVFTVTKIMFF